MAIKNQKDWNLIGFLGNRNYEEANRIGKDFLYDSQNSRFEAGKWSSRKGYEEYGDLLVGGSEDRGLFNYEYHDGTELINRFTRYYGGDFYYDNSGTWTNITTSWSSDTEVAGQNYGNNLYVFNSTEGMGKISNTTFSVVDVARKATMVEEWQERLWIAGDPSSPRTVNASKAGTAGSPNSVEIFDTVSGGFVEFFGDGGNITGLKSWQNNLYVFKPDRIFRFTGIDVSGVPFPVREPYSVTGGAVGPKAITEVENDVWFLFANRSGAIEVRRLASERDFALEARTRDLTWIIQNNIDDLAADQSNADFFYDGRTVFLALRTSESSENNVRVVYDNITRSWAIDKAVSIKQHIRVGSSIYFSKPNSSQIYLDQQGFSDAGNEYLWAGDTGLQDNSRPDLDKRARYLYIRGKKSPTKAIDVRLYRDDYDTYSEYTIPATTPSVVQTVSTLGGGILGAGILAGEAATDFEDTLENFNWHKSLLQTGRMFGVRCQTLINGDFVEIEQVIVSYVPLPRKHTYVTV